MDQTYIWIGTGLIAVASIGVLALMERRRQLAQEVRQTAYDEYLERRAAMKAESQRKIAEALSRRDRDRAFEVGRATERRTLEARREEAKPVTRPIGRATGPVRSSELRSTDSYIGGGHDSMSLHHPLNPIHHSSFDDCSSRSSGSSWGGSSSSSYDSGSSSSSDSSSSSSCD